MDIRAQRLREAVEKYGPDAPDGRDRGTHRLVKRKIPGRIAGSFYAFRQYLDGTRPIPDEVLEAVTKVLPVTLDWLTGSDGSDGSALPVTPPPNEQPAPPASEGYEDIRSVVLKAGKEPDDHALETLDPKYPRNGLSRRNWSLLYAVVGEQKSLKQVADETGLSKARVSGIVIEYAGLVRQAAGL